MRIKEEGLLLLSVLSSVLLTVAESEDKCSLVQKDLQLHGKFAAESAALDSSCECLGWREAYHSYFVQCGQGHEMDMLAMPRHSLHHIGRNNELCEIFFGRLPNDNFCMNEDFPSSNKQWCYVSPHCKDGKELPEARGLGGFYNSPSKEDGEPRTKTCEQNKDRFFADLTVEELNVYAAKHELDVGLLMKFAYPTLGGGMKLANVLPFWNLNSTVALGKKAPPSVKPLEGMQRSMLETYATAGLTVFIDSDSGHPPYGIMEGQSLYIVHSTDVQADLARAGANQWLKNTNKVAVRCVARCGGNHHKAVTP
eukprot:gnl/TRDRNA2_/TRDRNA2_41620_c0_seq1.p1 gnl/TRDRNA2_/TRDRNA2_41620_c0~~gnl/TRDRNA2_/TRDRNA2_41620_c0_seq1.p1  ORF type:complete len:310 (+),score=57.81 gnl/TRDRNA2_/TRDRNA2_41620_c0_seq1:109-1038(+)